MADDSSLLHFLVASREEDDYTPAFFPESLQETSLQSTITETPTSNNHVQEYSDPAPSTRSTRSISLSSNPGDYKPLQLIQNGFQNANIEIDLGGREHAPLGGHILNDDDEDENEETVKTGNIQIEQPSITSKVNFLNLKKARLKTRKFVEHLAVRIIGIVLVVFDITIVILDIVYDPQNPSTMEAYDIISVTVWCYFLLEIILRIFGKGKKFFKSKLDIFDLLIVMLTGSVTIVYVTVDLTGVYVKLVVVFRVLRIFLLVRLLSERKHVSKATRKMVSQNKRRYKVDDFDLDLTYITDRVIASSFPSSGSRALYRNPIEEVARFLDTKHQDHYKVYNLCIEPQFQYDESFFHHSVGHVRIYDHNVPKLKDLVQFCADAREWMEASGSNVLFIHCKGGKGRTGLVVCVWLLESGVFTTSAECMDYFGVRRTDYSEGDIYQGVDTPSQSRYVDYFQKIKYGLGGVIPSPVPLTLSSLRIEGIQGVGKGDARDFVMEMHYDETSIFICDFGQSSNCNVMYDFDTDTAIIQVKNSPEIAGDVKIKFKSSNKKIPKAYDDCAFFFWFYTGFINNNRLYLHRQDLDNPHKAETWKAFREAFAVDVRFNPVQDSDA